MFHINKLIFSLLLLSCLTGCSGETAETTQDVSTRDTSSQSDADTMTSAADVVADTDAAAQLDAEALDDTTAPGDTSIEDTSPPEDLMVGDTTPPEDVTTPRDAPAVEYCERSVGMFCDYYMRCGRMVAASIEECEATFLEVCNAIYEPHYIELEARGALALGRRDRAVFGASGSSRVRGPNL